MSVSSTSFDAPILLDAKNFSSLQRTPWAGGMLATGIKSDLAASSRQLIGESWEFSCDPELPSKLASGTQLLSQLIATNPADALSPSLVNAGRTQCDILVKLLNANTPLSLQIHPADDNAFLTANECGKPESWLILDAQPGAGLYLGFAKALGLKEIESHLNQGTFVPEMLHFVPVQAGDFFEIAPGVPHAIGPGVVILEPQRINPGKSGKTWRLWDWNRRYDKTGALDMSQGSPRELHVRQSVSLLNPEKQVGDTYVATLRKIPKTVATAKGARVKIFPGNGHYQVLYVELDANGSIIMNPSSGFAAMTMLSGRVRSTNHGKEKSNSITLSKGQSAFVPWKSLSQCIENSSRVAATFSWIIPAGNGAPSPQDGIVFQL